MWRIERDERGQPTRLVWGRVEPPIVVPLTGCPRCGSGRLFDGRCLDCSEGDVGWHPVRS